MALRFLADTIETEWKKETGFMPKRDVKIVDVFTRETLGDFSVREEQHEFYWLARDVLREQEK